MIQATLINLHPNEFSQEFHYYPFSVKLGRCVGSCNTLNDLSNKMYVPNKKEDLNLNVFNMITRINESETFLIAFSIYCCLIKYRAKQKHLLPFHESQRCRHKKRNKLLFQ